MPAVAITLCYGCTSSKEVSQSRASIPFQSTIPLPDQSAPAATANQPVSSENPTLQAKERFAELVVAHNKVMDEWSAKQQNEIKQHGIQQVLIEKLSKLNSSSIDKQEHAPASGSDGKSSHEKIVVIDPRLTLCSHGLFLFGSHISDAPISWGSANLPANLIAPGARLVLLGCHFGNVAGKVTMRLTTAGQQFDLPIFVAGYGWTDNIIQVSVPNTIAGVIDQTATIQLTTSTNQVSDSIEVPFVATRDLQRFDSDTYRNLVAVDAECPKATTDDSCGGAPVGDPRWPSGRTIVVEHVKSCCHSVKGTDTFYIKLNNGWTLPRLDPLFGTTSQYEYDSGEYNFEAGGFTTCWWFGNHGGYASANLGQSSLQAGYTVQVSFNWNVGSVCSGAHYDTDVYIMGPIGVPYW